MSRQITPKPTPTVKVVNKTPDNTTPIQMNRTNTNVSYVPGEVIIRYNLNGSMQAQTTAGISGMVSAAVGASVVADLSSPTLPGVQLMKLPGNMSVEEGVSKLEANPLVAYAEPNYIISLNDPPVAGEISAQTVTPKIPNDPSYSVLWGMSNGADHDIDAPEAWNLSTGSQTVIVAVVDTGVAYNHEDLAANMWTNSDEIPGNGIDDDGNNYIDDIRGWNFVSNTNDPNDDKGHGTHCAGTIGAIGNNSIGVVGVNWNVRIMPVKFLNSLGSGTTDGAIQAINYANRNGASVISNSWGGGGYSQALKDAIDASSAVVVCAAGNDYANTAIYPAAFDSANIISVAASDSSDNRPAFSNYHVSLVDVAAPGVYIYSTYLNNQYAYMDGTSMATPHVAGLAALIKARSPSLTNLQIRQIILDSVDK
ncbi:MAG: peptidase S8/S53 subtilisin kexin sedolisin, partial [Methanomicrobiales archaeon HGW-Methanomicrobiales-4]